jgi:hypothetical protein
MVVCCASVDKISPTRPRRGNASITCAAVKKAYVGSNQNARTEKSRFLYFALALDPHKPYGELPQVLRGRFDEISGKFRNRTFSRLAHF